MDYESISFHECIFPPLSLIPFPLSFPVFLHLCHSLFSVSHEPMAVGLNVLTKELSCIIYIQAVITSNGMLSNKYKYIQKLREENR